MGRASNPLQKPKPIRTKGDSNFEKLLSPIRKTVSLTDMDGMGLRVKPSPMSYRGETPGRAKDIKCSDAPLLIISASKLHRTPPTILRNHHVLVRLHQRPTHSPSPRSDSIRLQRRYLHRHRREHRSRL